MGTLNPSLALQHHLITMSTAVISDRTGVENMDGQGILAGQLKAHARPWTGCIPIEQLTKDNLPPFYVRLQDDQVGHLAHWVSVTRGSITRLKLGQFWPWDFDGMGKILLKRENWGAEYGGCGKDTGKGLGGGKKVPTWIDPGLPPTYTSSHKFMARELDALKRSAILKRKAEEEAGRNVCMPVKKPRLGSMGTELKKLKDTAEKKRQGSITEKERHAGVKPELQDAMQVVDKMMRSATETANQNAVLEAMLLKNEAQYIKDTDDMFGEWLAYNEVKRLEVDRMHEDHAAEIKARNTKIEMLKAEAKSAAFRLEREQKKISIRDERLAKVKNRWEQSQDLMERKLKEVEEIAVVDLDELSEFNYEDDELDDGESDDDKSDLGAEPEEAQDKAMEEQKQEGRQKEEEQKQELKAERKQEPQQIKEAQKEQKREPSEKQPETKDPKPQVGKPGKTISRETTKSVDAIDFVNLEEGDESDEGPISSKRKQKSRSRPGQSH